MQNGEIGKRASVTPPFLGTSTGAPSAAGDQHHDAVRVVSVLGKIQRMSEQLFPGPVSVEYASDPEDSSHEYVVFDVVAQGEFADYRDRIFQWHDEVERIVPGALGQFRLIVHPH